jgi:prepilin-type N-terminal cleavage/methylation domain-containing protein
MNKGARGFTMVELIMTIAIGSVLVLGIVLFTRTQFEQSVRSSDLLTAMNLARLKMADLDRQAYASIPATGSTTNYAADPVIPGFIVRLNVTLVESAGAGANLRELKQLELLVDYVGGDFVPPLARLITYRQNGTSFGNGT